MFKCDFILNTKDTIIIKGIQGSVLTAFHYDSEGWYIEMIDTEGKYRYYKQIYDGGEVQKI